jgi:hypothetical protein
VTARFQRLVLNGLVALAVALVARRLRAALGR